VTAEIGEAGTDLGPMRVPDLISAARDSAAQFGAAEALVVRLETYPEPVIAYAVARASTRQAVDGLIERIDEAMMRHAARARCREALDRLRLWMTDKWIDICLSVGAGSGPRALANIPVWTIVGGAPVCTRGLPASTVVIVPSFLSRQGRCCSRLHDSSPLLGAFWVPEYQHWWRRYLCDIRTYGRRLIARSRSPRRDRRSPGAFRAAVQSRPC
jgi:hypothetical protein